MITLPSVTLVAITTKDYGGTISAIQKSLQRITPAKTIFFCDINITIPNVEVIQVQIKGWEDYNRWIIKELYKFIETSHILVIQHDGYPIDETQWTDEFLDYDYIGAKWNYTDNKNVGNGGFSMRSYLLMEAVANDPAIEITSPEDEVICRLYRKYLEKTHGIKFAPEELADRFSFECHKPVQPTLGFHGFHFEPYRPHIKLKREGACGDVIMMEPILEYFHNKGYTVVLDTPMHFYSYFSNHFFPVKHTSHIDHRIKYEKEISLNMGYEIEPKNLVLKSYAKICGIDDLKLRNSKLNFKVTPDNKLFKKYAVIHIDEVGIPHREITGVDFKKVQKHIESLGFTVIQVGKRKHEECGLYMNCPTEQMLEYVVGGADFVLSNDSGVGQIAVALGIPAVIMFQSVNPEYRYYDFTKIKVIQGSCPKEETAFCYHNFLSVRGGDCVYNKNLPPCSIFNSDIINKAITEFVNDGFTVPIIDRPGVRKNMFKVHGNLGDKPSYESNKTFMGIKPSKWIHHKAGNYYNEDIPSLLMPEATIINRSDIFKLIEQ